MTGAIAAVRVRGQIGIKAQIKDAMMSLNLTRPNHCVVVPNRPDYVGQLRKTKDYVTFGPVDAATISDLIRKRGRLAGDKPVTDAFVKENTSFDGIDAWAAAIAGGQASYGGVDGLKPLFRLNPPKNGYRGGAKRSIKAGGSLGEREQLDSMAKLLTRMM